MSFIWNEILYRPIYNAFIFIYDVIPFQDAGVAIIILTLLIRFVLLPLTWTAMKSQRMMQSMQPEMNKIKEKYKEDKQAQTQELMKFYKENGINPLASCLPMLIQLPVMIALYRVLRNLTLDQYDLLYSFVSQPETLNTMFLGFIDLTLPFWPLAILTGLAQLVYSLLLKPSAKKKKQEEVKVVKEDGIDAEQITSMMTGQFTYVMPIMTTFIAWNLLAGLPLYWVTTTIFNSIFQLIMVKKYPVKEVDATSVTSEVAAEKEEVVWDNEPEVLETVKEKNVTVSVKKRS